MSLTGRNSKCSSCFSSFAQIAAVPYDWRITLLIIILAHAVLSFILEVCSHSHISLRTTSLFPIFYLFLYQIAFCFHSAYSLSIMRFLNNWVIHSNIPDCAFVGLRLNKVESSDSSKCFLESDPWRSVEVFSDQAECKVDQQTTRC